MEIEILTELVGIALVWIEGLQLSVGECLQLRGSVPEEVVLALVHREPSAHRRLAVHTD